MATCQTTNVIIVLKRVNTDSTGVTRCAQQLGRKRGVDVFVILVIVLASCTLRLLRAHWLDGSRRLTSIDRLLRISLLLVGLVDLSSP
jgi:hypothetical protein